ncbi:nuclear factor of activated T-cells, cytoplasmic 3 isoform X2 [Corythoichthys intestinalis]|uniref:nuclear factor of activated T-cells, cytoplasmic 3 isoform X2 n=1 Tax=Corythoichthys intestinalis TaxID=161448 RepID=UPI0025A65432|nr:nuclear factor of activated T-cells, cytoplasmic 3 isoform X2 [Corythoichthys intestinalis]XP_061812999.1 nuclear factor of activated T-cells, cytoplasmic 3-like [Nerophis lumbriciformis]
MSSANCPEELDFGLIFEEGEHNEGLAAQLAPTHYQQYASPAYGAQGNSPSFPCPSIQITAIAASTNSNNDESLGAEGGYLESSWPRNQLYLPLEPCYRDAPFCPSPCSSLSSRSWISDLSSCDSFSHANGDNADSDLRDAALLLALGTPGCGNQGGGAFGVELWQQKYQNPQNSASVSPALSPYQSPQHSPRASISEDTWMNRRPASRPSSRPTSPCGKRRYANGDAFARSPSPQCLPSVTLGGSPWGSVTDVTAAGPLGLSYQELDVPSKTRRKSGTRMGVMMGESFPEDMGGSRVPTPREESRDSGDLAEVFLQVPPHFSWTAPTNATAPLFRPSSPPPLDFPLPSSFGPNRLSVEAEPRPYHRAHYETEGSRGAIKTHDGGHPKVKLSGPCWRPPSSLLVFMGTADERQPLRPHSFYRVHRVTGKTVNTSCQEKMVDETKVLEVPLMPDNDMTATIDCVGILKLRNADIELKKGETDVGRKNTRVRVVFRVALPQPDGQTLWLQTTSHPVECSQRSGLELPHVDQFAPASCQQEGGQRLVILGSNMSSRSRVVFAEKSPDGRVLWEADAAVVPEKSSSSSLTVDIPAYNHKTRVPVQVLFYVANGKRRSAWQNFTYLPGTPKQFAPPPCQVAALDEEALHYLPGEPALHSGLHIKREAQDTHTVALLELQEITLDDVNEIIDRDACNQSSATRADPPDQYHQCDWDFKSGEAVLPSLSQH